MTGLIYNEKQYTKEHALLLKAITDVSIVRNEFTVFPILNKEDHRVSWDELLEDLGTFYSPNPFNSPRFDVASKPAYLDVSLIHDEFTIDEHEKLRREKGLTPIQVAKDRQALKFARDEDMYAIAGESSAVNSVPGFSDTTNVSTVVTTELDLTNFATWKTTLNAMIDQLDTSLRNSGNGPGVEQFPLRLMVTTDVKKRMKEVSSTLDDNFTGLDYALKLLEQESPGKGSGIVVSNNLGATVSKSGNRFSVTTAGTTNACMYSPHPEHMGIFASIFFRGEEDGPKNSMLLWDEERWRFKAFKQGSMMYSGTVDIVA